MITLRKIAREIIELESGGGQSVDSNLSEAYVIQYVRQASNLVLAPKIYEKLSQDDRSGLHMMIVTYSVNVQGTNPNKYIDLPEFYISLPFNKGLHAIAPVQDPTNHFIPRHNPSVSRNLPCADLDPGQYSFWTKGLKVYFDGDQVDFGKVLVDLVVASPDSIGVDSSLPIFPEHQIEIIQKAREMIKGMPLQDKILDGNPDKMVKTQR